MSSAGEETTAANTLLMRPADVPDPGGPVVRAVPLCLHIDTVAAVKGNTLPYRAHIRFSELVSVAEDSLRSIYIEFDFSQLDAKAEAYLGNLSEDEAQALYERVGVAALRIYMLRRVRGEFIDGLDGFSEFSGQSGASSSNDWLSRDADSGPRLS